MPRLLVRRAGRCRSVTRLTPLLALAVHLAGCSKEPEKPKVDPIKSTEYIKPFTPPEATGVKAPKIAFVDATPNSGLDFKQVNGAYGKKYLPETMGSGVVLFDYDNDGLLDVFCVQGAEWPDHVTLKEAPTCKLFKNLGGMKFQDVTKETGLDLALIGMGACAADYDGDGDMDLFITALGPYHLMRNDEIEIKDEKTGQARKARKFTDVTAQSGLVTTTWKDGQGREHPSWSTSAAWLDYDGDGVLDLFVCHYVHWSIENDIREILFANTKAYTKPTNYKADCCRLFRGKGDGTFEDVTKEAGVEKDNSKSLGVAIGDVNHDGHPDLAVSNDMQPNYLFVSQPGGKFSEEANDCGIAYDENGRARAGMGIDMSDLANNGKFVISIGNFSREPVSLYTEGGEALHFLDRAAPARIATPTDLSLTFGVLFCDYDLDGRLDILVCNGHIEPEIGQVEQAVTYKQATQLFWNRGDSMFTDVSNEVGEVFQRKVVGRGIAAGDLDNDGDLDFVLTQNGLDAILVRNDQALGNGWLRTRLEGAGKNRNAIGATVTVTFGDKKLSRDVRTGSSYLSQCDLAPTFGLGPKAPESVDVEVRWPSGKSERFPQLTANREHRLVEGTGK